MIYAAAAAAFFMSGWITHSLLLAWLQRRRRPYSWDCPEHRFHVESLDPYVTLDVTEAHRTEFHR